MNKTFLRYIFYFLSTTLLFAQREADNWIFGTNAGLNFSSGNPVNLSSNMIRMNTLEGCATISDASGKLLFYVGAASPSASVLTVWVPFDENGDGVHDTMPNGNNLIGHVSATQAAIIVPKPEDSNIYYIFTVDAYGNTNRGLYYYTVDMTLNAGKGAVVGTGTQLLQKSAEKITAVKNNDCTSIWVITFSSANGSTYSLNTFHAFNVSTTGVSNTSVTSNSGILPILNAGGRGYLKLNPEGNKLAIAHQSNNSAYLYDFDNTTGVVSNPLKLIFPIENETYGLEFSKEGKRLYVSTVDPLGVNDLDLLNDGFLYQFNLEAPNPENTAVEIDAVYQNLFRTGLQLAPNGKIYRTMPTDYNNGSQFLSVINNPDALGTACNYAENAVNLGIGIGHQGLPPFIQSIFSTNLEIIHKVNLNTNDLHLCDDETYKLFVDLTTLPATSTFEWTKNGVLMPETTDFIIIDKSGLNGNGHYILTVDPNDGTCKMLGEAIVTYHPYPILNSNISLKQCDDDTDGFVAFNLNEAKVLLSANYLNESFSYYKTEADALTQSNPIQNPTTYLNSTSNFETLWVAVKSLYGCISIIDFELQVATTQIPSNLLITMKDCDNLLMDNNDTNGIVPFDLSAAMTQLRAIFPTTANINIQFYKNMNDALAEQNPITNLTNYQNISSPYHQFLTIRIDDNLNNACLGLGEHIELIVNPIPAFDLLFTNYYCLNEGPATLAPTNYSGTFTFEWADQFGNILGTSNSLVINKGGTYTLTLFDSINCSRTKSITVKESQESKLTIDDLAITHFQNNNSVTIPTGTTFGIGNYLYSLDDLSFSNQVFYDELPGGEHTLTIMDQNGCKFHYLTFSILDYMRFFTPNDDGYNDFWNLLGGDTQPKALIHVFDRFGKLLSKIDPSGNGWDGNFNGSPLPSSDYWFSIELEDGSVYKGHFSLIRR